MIPSAAVWNKTFKKSTEGFHFPLFSFKGLAPFLETMNKYICNKYTEESSIQWGRHLPSMMPSVAVWNKNFKKATEGFNFPLFSFTELPPFLEIMNKYIYNKCTDEALIQWGRAAYSAVYRFLEWPSDGWEYITCHSSIDWNHYPIVTSQSHTHILPLLHSQQHSSAWIMVIPSQSYVSIIVWGLSDIPSRTLRTKLNPYFFYQAMS